MGPTASSSNSQYSFDAQSASELQGAAFAAGVMNSVSAANIKPTWISLMVTSSLDSVVAVKGVDV